MQHIFRYIDGLENDAVRELMYETHELITQLLPQVAPKIKWKIPCYYYYGSYFCYLNTYKDHMYISLINKKEHLYSETLEIEHLKIASKVFIKNRKVLRSDALSELIMEAAVLHEAMFKK